jgi:hypothetical protein
MKRSLLCFTLGFLLLLVVAGIPAAASPTVTSISPSSGPNNMVITVTIHGTGFNKDSSAFISSCDSSNIVYGTVTKWTATSLTATFNLINVKPVTYAVTVNSPFYDMAGNYWPKDGGSLSNAFTVYQGTGTVVTTATTSGTSGSTTTVRTTATTASSSGEGENSVFFETNPSGAEIWLNGDDVGTSTFTYYTDRDGTYDVVAKKTGYEDYEAKVTILSGQRVRFYGVLTPLSSTDIDNPPANTSASPAPATGKTTPKKNSTTIKSTLKVPTPWGTDPPLTEESPVDPVLVLGAAGIVIGLALKKRR